MTENKEPLTFKQVLNCFRQAQKGLGKNDVDLEVWIGQKMYYVVRVGQFGIIKTVTLTLTDKPVFDLSGD
jgi:hypothetical protein